MMRQGATAGPSKELGISPDWSQGYHQLFLKMGSGLTFEYSVLSLKHGQQKTK
jgi:hypothetical protein